MADVQKPVESKPVEAPAAEAPAAETTATEAPAESSAPAEAAAAAEETTPKEEAKPKSDGHLEYRSPHFPGRFLYSKKHFWFGEEAVDVTKKPSFSHEIAAWASQTGKGILFIGDKASPTGAIHLKDASEAVTKGTNEFHFTRGSEKHSFKASSTEERDNWVAQFNAKIAEAKALVDEVVESETYKSTLASLKPAAPAKKEKEAKAAPAETPAESSTAAEVKPGAAAPEEPTEAPAETPKDTTKEEGKRSSSKKRGSVFAVFGKKEKKAAEETPAEPAASTEAAEPAATEAPAEAPATEAAAPAEAAAEPAAADETKPEAPKESKPNAHKRNSFFGGFSLGKKKPEAEASTSAAPVTEAPAEPAEPIADSAPEIPPVETTTPLAVEVSSPANAPTETTTAEAPAATNGESKKEVKSEKRKSSLPFAFGTHKKEKAATSDEEGADKPKSPSVFSKLRGTIKGKGKAVEKPTAEAPAETEAPAAAEPVAEASEPAKAEASEAPEADKPAEPAAAVEEPTKPENPLEKPGAAVTASA